MRSIRWKQAHDDYCKYVADNGMSVNDGRKIYEFAKWLADEITFHRATIFAGDPAGARKIIDFPAQRINRYLGETYCVPEHKIITIDIEDPRVALGEVTYCIKCNNIVAWGLKQKIIPPTALTEHEKEKLR